MRVNYYACARIRMSTYLEVTDVTLQTTSSNDAAIIFRPMQRPGDASYRPGVRGPSEGVFDREESPPPPLPLPSVERGHVVAPVTHKMIYVCRSDCRKLAGIISSEQARVSNSR